MLSTKTATLVSALLAVSSGCTANVAKQGVSLPQDKIATSSVRDLCAVYAPNRDPMIRSELERRGTFSPAEWKLIAKKTAPPGTREEVLWCSWGLPGEYGDVTEVSTNSGPGRRYRYIVMGSITADFIVVDGKVASFTTR